jgi:hypothetical protein
VRSLFVLSFFHLLHHSFINAISIVVILIVCPPESAVVCLAHDASDLQRAACNARAGDRYGLTNQNLFRMLEANPL